LIFFSIQLVDKFERRLSLKPKLQYTLQKRN
jgi:hypothetical protein